MELKEVPQSAQLACALEVSAYPKPGNVHRTSDLEDMDFNKFIVSSIVIGPPIYRIARRGFKAGNGEIDSTKIGVGKCVKKSIDKTVKWTDENTNFGILMLIVPLAAAGGKTVAENSDLSPRAVRNNLADVLESTTTEDALNVYEAMSIAELGGLGDVDKFSAREENSLKEIKEESVTLYDLMSISADWDNISKEWTTNMSITFESGYPFLKKLYKQNNNLNKAIVQTYLRILSEYKDTLIERKYGEKIAEEASRKAQSVLDKGGIYEPEGMKALENLDEEFKERKINPGTTADLVASSLMISILDGIKP